MLHLTRTHQTCARLIYVHNSLVSIIAAVPVYTIKYHCSYSYLVIIDHSVDHPEGKFYVINLPVARCLLCAPCCCQLLLLQPLASNTATDCGLQGNDAPWGVLCVLSTKPTFTVHYFLPTHYGRFLFSNLVGCEQLWYCSYLLSFMGIVFGPERILLVTLYQVIVWR